MSFLRPAAVSGQFYPSSPAELRALVDSQLGDCAGARDAIGVVAPHAGYVYSGRIAGQVYASVTVPSSVIVLCPNHTGAGARASIISSGSFATPVGEIPIDERLARRVMERGGLTEDVRAHAREHAIEVHLPFLVARQPDLQLVPICLAGLSVESCDQLGQALASAIAEHETPVLLVASTDMSHYISATEAAGLDRLAIERIEALDGHGLYRVVVERDISMCGFIPTTVVLAAARARGAVSARLIRYGHSGEVNGDLDHVVGYAGMVIS